MKIERIRNPKQRRLNLKTKVERGESRGEGSEGGRRYKKRVGR